MYIENNILKHHLRNCYFINGTAYAGKSTMVAMLADKYDMIHCGENYGLQEMRAVADPVLQPNLCYTKQMPSWEAFVSRTPAEYEAWVKGNKGELAQFEVAELLRLSASGKRIIVDTNIPLETLKAIAEQFNTIVFNATIRESTKTREAQTARMNLFDYAPKSTTALLCFVKD